MANDLIENDGVMDAFADAVGDSRSIVTTAQQAPVAMRPVGAQAITIRREPSRVLADIRTFAAAAGDSWFYSWDVRDKNSKRPDGKTTIEGPSVKLANDVARLYGNCSLGVDRIEDIGTHWNIYVTFIDFETGYEYRRAFQQRKGQAVGSMDAERARDIALQIGMSKAIRNAAVNALGTFCDFAMNEAKGAIVGKVEKRLDYYRDKTIARLAELGVTQLRVEKHHGKPAASWTAMDVAKVIAEIQAISEGMTTAADLWPDGSGGDGSKPDKLAAFGGDETPAKNGGGSVIDKKPPPTQAELQATAEGHAAQAAGAGVVTSQDLTKAQNPSNSKGAVQETQQNRASSSDPVKPADVGQSQRGATPATMEAAATVRSPAKPAPEAIPAGVFYNPDAEAFHDERGNVMPEGFAEKWGSRSSEFPDRMRKPAAEGRAPGPREDGPVPAGPVTAAGEPVRHDPKTGVADDPLEVPAFLKRTETAADKLAAQASGNASEKSNAVAQDSAKPGTPGPDDDPKRHLTAAWVRSQYEGMPPDFVAGYIARSRALDAVSKDADVANNPKRARMFKTGWDTRDRMLDAPAMPK